MAIHHRILSARVMLVILTFWVSLGVPHHANASSVLEQFQSEQIAVIQRARAYTASIAVTFYTSDDALRQKYNPQGATGETGSGVIISKDGYIVTNAHVGDGLKAARDGIKPEKIYGYRITLTDKRTFDAMLVGVSPITDLAILKLKVPPSDLQVAQLGDSDQLLAGMMVFPVGSPMGFEDSVSHGIVSNARRKLPDGDLKNITLIQTDAAINPGNSGGPLVNILGEVVGINTLIFSKSGMSSGLGFAIPSNIVKEFIVSFKAGSKSDGDLGVKVENIDKQSRALFGITVDGVRVTTVDPKGAAYGVLSPGDIIVELDGSPTVDASRFTRTVREKGSSAALKLTVVRGSKRMSVTIQNGKTL